MFWNYRISNKWQGKKQGRHTTYATNSKTKGKEDVLRLTNQLNLSQKQFDQLVALLAKEKKTLLAVNFISIMTKTTNWILDSRASSNHIVSDKALIKDKVKLERLIKVSWSNEETTTTIKLIRNVKITDHISLKNVFCLAYFNCN